VADGRRASDRAAAEPWFVTLDQIEAADPLPPTVASLAHPVLLIRHAATSWTGKRWCGRADPGLTVAGRRAARILADDVRRELAAMSTAALLVSPARRARQTSAPLETALGIRAMIDEDLLEVDVGAAEGLDWTGLEARFPTVAADVARGIQPDWPDGEARDDVERRAARMVERIRALATDRPLVVVSHGAILHAIALRLAPPPSPDPVALGPAGILRFQPAPQRSDAVR
jgi:probable phosphoglycerate mutase